MRSFVPTPISAPAIRGATFRPGSGNVPWDLPPHCWPPCGECGGLTSCLLQVPVHGHLDQADPLVGDADLSDRVLQVFACERPTVCCVWTPRAGANAAFFPSTNVTVPASGLSSRAFPSARRAGSRAGFRKTVPCRTEMATGLAATARFHELAETMRFPQPLQVRFESQAWRRALLDRWIHRSGRSGS